MTRRVLQILLAALGIVAIPAGLVAILGGAATIPGGGSVSESVDSELRFYATFWVVLGGVALWLVPRVGSETTIVRIVGGAVFAAGIARVISLVSVGAPHWSQVVLMAIELLLGPILVGLQARIASSEASDRR
jgi:thiol:disulfide interchange protein